MKKSNNDTLDRLAILTSQNNRKFLRRFVSTSIIAEALEWGRGFYIGLLLGPEYNVGLDDRLFVNICNSLTLKQRLCLVPAQGLSALGPQSFFKVMSLIQDAILKESPGDIARYLEQLSRTLLIFFQHNPRAIRRFDTRLFERAVDRIPNRNVLPRTIGIQLLFGLNVEKNVEKALKLNKDKRALDFFADVLCFNFKERDTICARFGADAAGRRILSRVKYFQNAWKTHRKR